MDYAVGVLELRSIARGIEASDAALKSAGIRLISAQPICPGKFELVITGELAQVSAAMDRVRAGFEESLLDSVLLGRIDPAVVRALLGAQPEAKRGALGTIETFTVASVILAADCAVKSADVEILELRTARGMGGKGVVLLTGDVADVTAAVEAGARYAKEQGVFVGQSILGAPHEELWNFL
ncbi:BMC domain-containing protein [uncultured Anaerotruncus sp.]|uniref:BMC domain-containing protein n=1 Tax=uncultured Anaerotruncus sp. TaxID=905011 RepID=UPI00280BB24F|nr:BMC domain-containing protein [uncultured Anaerotruncus sp.]